MTSDIKGTEAEKLHDLGMFVGKVAAAKTLLQDAISIGGLADVPKTLLIDLDVIVADLDDLPLGKLSVDRVRRLLAKPDPVRPKDVTFLSVGSMRKSEYEIRVKKKRVGAVSYCPDRGRWYWYGQGVNSIGIADSARDLPGCKEEARRHFSENTNSCSGS